MMRWTLSSALLILAACSGGPDEEQPAGTADTAAPATQTGAQPAAPAAGADISYAPDASVNPATAPEAGAGTGEKAIPPAIQGRWALKAADCTAQRGTDLTALVIDAHRLRFYESAGDLARVRERSANRIVADYKFSGEGEEWDRMMLLAVEDGGRTLVRRDYGEGVPAEGMRYTRCAAGAPQ